jgi:hypothetical protein
MPVVLHIEPHGEEQRLKTRDQQKPKNQKGSRGNGPQVDPVVKRSQKKDRAQG